MSWAVRFVLVVKIAFVYINVAAAQDAIESCWNRDVQCNIEGQFSRDGFVKPFFVNINCDDDGEPSQATSVIRRFMGIQTILLNGCNVTRNNTIGVEHIDDPRSVTHLTINLFKVEKFVSEYLTKFKSLNTLQLISNVFEELVDESFRGLNSMKTLMILNNKLKAISQHSLVKLTNLQNLTIVEPNLSIDVLDFTSCESLKYIQLEVFVYEWQALPLSLETLQISNTQLIFSRRTFGIEKCENLTHMSITNSEVHQFPSLESSSLRILNLTRNNVHQLALNDLRNLEILDLSDNQLSVIDSNLLKSMVRLREIYLENNRIQKVSKTAFDFNTQLEIIKISGNQLKYLQFTDNFAQKQLKMFVDDNPWSCVWVLNVSAEYPTIFSIFHYNKYSNKNRVNVNGLNCLLYDGNGYNFYESSASTEIIPISSTLPFAENIEISYRRNPKDTALITLVILVVGVVFLFFLLYLHIKCRENSNEPFYRSLPYDTQQMSDRVDIIRRKLPATDYEAPIATTNTDLNDVIYEQIQEKYLHDGFDDVNSVVSYKLAIANSEALK